MANNRIDQLISERNESVRDFAKRCGVSEQTLYKITKKPTMRNISIDVFLKIAKGLGMTAEELYYGDTNKAPSNIYSDSRQQEANEIWSHVNEAYRKQMWEHAKVIDMAYNKSAERDSVQEVAI